MPSRLPHGRERDRRPPPRPARTAPSRGTWPTTTREPAGLQGERHQPGPLRPLTGDRQHAEDRQQVALRCAGGAQEVVEREVRLGADDEEDQDDGQAVIAADAG